MQSFRENPRNFIALQDALGKAFSKKICGTDLHKRFTEWYAYLLSNLEQDSLNTNLRTFNESKKINPGSSLTRLSPAFYKLLWQKFCLIHKIDPEEESILELVGNLWRVALSLDTVERFEDENRYYRNWLEEQKSIKDIQEKPDSYRFINDKNRFLQNCTREYEAHIKEKTHDYFKTLQKKHIQNADQIAKRIEGLEEEITQNPDEAHINDLKEVLLKTISSCKTLLKEDIHLQLSKNPKMEAISYPFNHSGIFKSLDEDYKDLLMGVESLGDFYTEQQKKPRVRQLIPIIKAQSLEELYVTQDISSAKKRNKAEYSSEVIKRIERIMKSSCPSWAKHPEEWLELKSVVIAQQNRWNLPNDKDESMSIRIYNLKKSRENLIRRQQDEINARINQATEDQYQLAHYTIEIESAYLDYCKRNNSIIAKIFTDICQEYERPLKQLEKNYKIHEKTIHSIMSKFINDHKTSQSYERWLAIEIKRIKASGLLSLLAASLAVPTFALTGFSVSLILGTCFSAISLVALVNASVRFCIMQSSHFPSLSLKNSSPPIQTTVDHSTHGIKRRLSPDNETYTLIQKYGLDPNKADIDTNGNRIFTLLNGASLQFFGNKARVIKKDQDKSVPVLPEEVQGLIMKNDRIRA